MRKTITTILFSFFSLMCLAQNDTLLIENFDQDVTQNLNGNWQQATPPPGVNSDINWYNYDLDGIPDGSTQGRPGEWFWSPGGFASVDTGTGSGDGCLFSNSWTNVASDPVQNFLVTPAIQIIDANAVLHWKSATRQTPRYLDGYRILVSSGTNDLNAFSDTIVRAAEMTALPTPPADTNAFSSYSFGPAGAWIQGLDGTFIEFDGDSSRLIGVQKDTSVSLASYIGQTIYIAFEHFTYDDNLLSLDDIVVTGTNPIGFDELYANTMKMYAYPNPALKNTTLNFTLSSVSDVMIRVTDVLGNEVFVRHINGVSGKNALPVNVEQYAEGTYFYTVTSRTATNTGRFAVVK